MPDISAGVTWRLREDLMTGATNASLAARARALADAAARGSLERRAAGVVSVALATTSSIAAAHRALGTVREADVKRAARQLPPQISPDHHELTAPFPPPPPPTTCP